MGAGFSIKAKANAAAEILIYEDVGSQYMDGVTARQFSDELSAMGDVKTIDVRIASLGGDVNEGLAMYRRLVDHPARVIVHIDGYACSISAVIAMAGNEIRISEAGAVMIHDAHAIAAGNADDFTSFAERLRATSASIADVFVARTGNKAEKVRDWMREETWFYGKEAVDAGFAQSVVKSLRVAARADLALHNFRKAPADLVGTPRADALKQRLAQMRSKIERHRATAA